MRKTWLPMVAVFALFLAAGLYAAEKAVTFEGTLVDSKCYLADNSNTGNDHMGIKGCGTICLKAGNPAGILTKDKRFHTIVAPSVALAPYVGETIRVEGSLHSGAVLAKKIEVSKAGKWEEIKLTGMM